MKTAAEVIAEALKTPVRMDELPPEDPLRVKSEEVSNIFTHGVQLIREMADPRLQVLGQHIWDIFHYRHVNLVLGPPVRQLTITVIRRGELIEALVLAPEAWEDQVQKHPFMELGAIICIGSQAVDFYNDRLTSETSEAMRRRGQAYEALYLKILDGQVPLNSYQQQLLQRPPALELYPYKPVQPKD